MKRWCQILILVFAFSACRTTEVAKVNLSESSSSISTTCELLIKFKSDEAIKRVMLRLDHLRAVLINEASSTEKIHLIRLNCKQDELDGLIHKLSQLDGVEWVRSPG